MNPLPLSPDAAMVVALAGSALPYAGSPDDEVERWLRALRLYGEAGRLLQGMGLGEARLVYLEKSPAPATSRQPEQAVAAVTAAAGHFAGRRGCSSIGTIDLLVAVMREYAEPFDRALEARGSDRWELVECLAEKLDAPLQEHQLQ